MGPDGPKWGRELFFPINPDLADILGDTDFDFENFYFFDFFGSQISRFPGSQKSGLGRAWAGLGPGLGLGPGGALGWVPTGFHGFPRVFPRVSHGFPMGFPWAGPSGGPGPRIVEVLSPIPLWLLRYDTQ